MKVSPGMQSTHTLRNVGMGISSGHSTDNLRLAEIKGVSTSPRAMISTEYYSRNNQLRSQMSNKSPEGTQSSALLQRSGSKGV